MKKVVLLIIMAVLLVSFAACESADIDETAYAEIKGDYQCTDEECGLWWHLSIGGGELSVYDSEAGNPGFEGKIVFLDSSSIKVKIDEDLFDCFPLDTWQQEGKYIILTYERTSSGIVLSNNGAGVNFSIE